MQRVLLSPRAVLWRVKTLTWGSYPYSGPCAAPLGSGDGFGYANDELSGNSIHYLPNLNTGTRILTTILTTKIPTDYGKSRSEDFLGPSVGSRESGALGERKKRKREDSTADTNFDPIPGPSHNGYAMDNNWAKGTNVPDAMLNPLLE